MAYNNGFPMNYGYYQPQMPIAAPQPAQQQTNGIIWVQGEAGAKSYLVAPNTTVQLWDSENQTIYLKSADASGMPSMRIIDYTFREQAAKPPMGLGQQGAQEYATRADLNALAGQIGTLQEQVNALKGAGSHE